MSLRSQLSTGHSAIQKSSGLSATEVCPYDLNYQRATVRYRSLQDSLQPRFVLTISIINGPQRDTEVFRTLCSLFSRPAATSVNRQEYDTKSSEVSAVCSHDPIECKQTNSAIQKSSGISRFVLTSSWSVNKPQCDTEVFRSLAICSRDPIECKLANSAIQKSSGISRFVLTSSTSANRRQYYTEVSPFVLLIP